MLDKILIISYFFPPNPGIGGRRWAKFAKYFLKMGVDVIVITTKPYPNSSSNWDKDTEQLYKEKRVVFVDKTQHSVFSGDKLLKIQDKLLYRILLPILKIITKGNYWDPSAKWGKKILPQVERLILDGYTNIVATGGPFTYLNDLFSLKDKYKNI